MHVSFINTVELLQSHGWIVLMPFIYVHSISMKINAIKFIVRKKRHTYTKLPQFSTKHNQTIKIYKFLFKIDFHLPLLLILSCELMSLIDFIFYIFFFLLILCRWVTSHIYNSIIDKNILNWFFRNHTNADYTQPQFNEIGGTSRNEIEQSKLSYCVICWAGKRYETKNKTEKLWCVACVRYATPK